MAGVCDRHFRMAIRRIGGLGLSMTEFALAAPLAARGRAALARLRFEDDERPVAVQVLGTDPEALGRAAAVVESLRPDACDLNLGCPMPKITRRGGGASLTDDPGRLREALEAMLSELTVPLTVKCRLGAGRLPGDENYLKVAEICQQTGVAAITLHPRSVRDKYAGQARWEHVRRLKTAVDIPVIGNGDVRSAGQALARQAETGCDAVMIGRGAIARPWIFRKIAAAWGVEGVAAPDPAAATAVVIDALGEMVAAEPPGRALHGLRAFAGRWAREAGAPREFREAVGSAPDAPSLLGRLSDALRARCEEREQPE